MAEGVGQDVPVPVQDEDIAHILAARQRVQDQVSQGDEVLEENEVRGPTSHVPGDGTAPLVDLPNERRPGHRLDLDDCAAAKEENQPERDPHDLHPDADPERPRDHAPRGQPRTHRPPSPASRGGATKRSIPSRERTVRPAGSSWRVRSALRRDSLNAGSSPGCAAIGGFR